MSIMFGCSQKQGESKDIMYKNKTIESTTNVKTTSEIKLLEDGLNLLSKQRKSLLDKLHEIEKNITCLDYLVYQINKKETIKNGY